MGERQGRGGGEKRREDKVDRERERGERENNLRRKKG